jgi:YD repeat-containing protein
MEVAFNNVLSGRYLQFYYDGNGRTTNVTDFTGRSWTYGYDSAGRGDLLTVTTPPAAGFPSGLTTRYTYLGTNQHWLETVTDRSGNTLLTNRYDSLGRVVQQIWGQAVYSFAYPSTTDRWVTNGNGFRVERIFDGNGQMTERRDYTAGLRPGDPAYYSTKYAYTTNNQQQAKIIYPAGNVQQSSYDSYGNLIQVRLKAGNTNDSSQDIATTYTYEPRFNSIKTLTDPNGNVTTYVYDYENSAFGSTNGNLMRVIKQAVGGISPTISYTYYLVSGIDYTCGQKEGCHENSIQADVN